MRHASTTPTTPSTPQSATQPPPSSAPAETTSTSFPNLDTITLDDIDLSTTADVANIPEKIGYLHDIGLNYGWGPTSMIEWTLEHIHIYTGLPWWASVALTAMSIRLAMLPLYIKSSDMTARQSALMSVTKPISDRMNEARRAGDNQTVQQAALQLMAVRRRAGLSMPKQMAPLFLQAVIGYCGFKLMRAMAALPVPALKTDGFLWLQDLTLSDPYLLLPLAMAGTMHLLVRQGGESGAAGLESMAPQMRFMMLYGMPGIIVFATGFQSGLVCIWFAASGALGVLQGLALKNKTVRERLGISPLYKPDKDEVDHGLMGAFTNIYGNKDGKSGAAAAAAAAAARGPKKHSTAWMNTTYQSPNLRRNMNSSGPSPGGRVIDVNPVNKSNPAPNPSATSPAADDMIQPNAPTAKKGSMFDQVSGKVSSWQKQFAKRELSEEEKAEKRKKDFKSRARAFEKRYQERGSRR